MNAADGAGSSDTMLDRGGWWLAVATVGLLLAVVRWPVEPCGGIGLLVIALIGAQHDRQELRAVALDHHDREITSLTRLDEDVRVFDDDAAAIADG